MTAAEHIVERLIGEGIDPALVEIATEHLKQMGQFQNAAFLRHSDNMAELHSYLRNGVFHRDDKTTAFIQQCQAELEQRFSTSGATLVRS